MPTFRIEKKSNYSVISNNAIQDKNLSLTARGLLIFMLSLADDWDFSCKGLIVATNTKETTLRNSLKELENNGYLKREPVKEKGIIRDWVYWIYEEPLVVSPQVVAPHVESPLVVKHAQINTNKQSTKEISNKEKIKEIKKEKNQRVVFTARTALDQPMIVPDSKAVNEELSQILKER